MSPKIGYMHLDVIKYYYSELKPNSLESDVDRIWNTVLPRYFLSDLNYGIEMQQRPWPGVAKAISDFIIRFVKNGQPKKVILIEDKRVSEESSSATWSEAVRQVTRYMMAARGEQFTRPSQVEDMYAIVTVGHYSRFYILEPNSQTLQDYPGTGGTYFEFKKDEDQIDHLLLELVDKTSH